MQNLTCHLQDFCFSAPAEDREGRAVQPTGAEGLSRLGDGGKIVCFTIHIVNLHASELRSLMIHFQMIHQLIPAPNYPPAHSARDKMLEVVNSFPQESFLSIFVGRQKFRSFILSAMMDTEVYKIWCDKRDQNISSTKSNILKKKTKYFYI